MSYRAFLLDSRYNGLLGGIPTNKKRVQIRLMKIFCRDSTVLNLEKPYLFSDIFEKMLVQLKNANAQRGTLNDMLAINMVSLFRLSSR